MKRPFYYDNVTAISGVFIQHMIKDTNKIVLEGCWFNGEIGYSMERWERGIMDCLNHKNQFSTP